jgi:NhaA family Na+:H+ antiporter
MGLELDCLARTPNADSPWCSVHLPSVSLHALTQLRSSLEQPGAVSLDTFGALTIDGTVDLVDDTLRGVHAKLAEQVGNAISEQARKEALRSLESRHLSVDGGAERQNGDNSLQTIRLEELLLPEQRVSLLDISVCGIASYDSPRPIVISLTRLKPRNDDEASMAYAALVFCSSEPAASAVAKEVGRALATTFMNEEFLNSMQKAQASHPEAVTMAFDKYLSTMTIVPTVYMDTCSSSAGVVRGRPVETYFLSDSLVDGMEKLIHRARGLAPATEKRHHYRSAKENTTSTLRNHFFVEVNSWTSSPIEEMTLVDDEVAAVHTGGEWNVIRRLRQGLEIDVASHEARPHLPRVSVGGLSRVRHLTGLKSVALDVPATTSSAATEAVAALLANSGLPDAAAEEIRRALTKLTRSQARLPRQLSKRVTYAEAPSDQGSSDLLTPTTEDEGCVVLTLTLHSLTDAQGIFGAFLRFEDVLECSFASTQTPVRFLWVLASSAGHKAEVDSVSDSLAAFAVDEDLMANLTSARDVSGFEAALDVQLNDLMIMPHTHVGHGHHGHGAKKSDSCPHSPGQKPRKQSTPTSEFCSEADDTMVSTPSKRSSAASSTASSNFGNLTTWQKTKQHCLWCRRKMQKYSVPLISGVFLALVWENIDHDSYYSFTHEAIWPDAKLCLPHCHTISLHFIVNDIFMCLFFGLAIKEVTEALLPGGSLNPLRRAANPLMATFGGVAGPVAAYIIMISMFNAFGVFDDLMCSTSVGGDAHRRLGAAVGSSSAGSSVVGFASSSSSSSVAHEELCGLEALYKGWGVPTATDISLAWMFALLVFGAGHPVINFLLLLAIVDDAIGMVIIAVFYPNPELPVEPVWLTLVLVAVLVAFIFRKLQVRVWAPYILVAGPVSWVGLLKAHVHPALALVVVVPFLPATHAEHIATPSLSEGEDARPSAGASIQVGSWSTEGFASGRRASQQMIRAITRTTMLRASTGLASTVRHATFIFTKNEEAALHDFEHRLKLPVDFGMFFFGLANAGVKLNGVGYVTASIATSLIIGKTLGIAGFSLLGVCLGFDLPAGITITDLFAMSAIAGVGLTVALFMANEAFMDKGLQGQAKLGAVLSVLSGGIGILIKKGGDRQRVSEGSALDDEEGEGSDEEEGDWTDELIMEDLLEVMKLQRKYRLRGVEVPIAKVARSVSKQRSTWATKELERNAALAAAAVANADLADNLPDTWAQPRSASKQSNPSRADSHPKRANRPKVSFQGPRISSTSAADVAGQKTSVVLEVDEVTAIE